MKIGEITVRLSVETGEFQRALTTLRVQVQAIERATEKRREMAHGWSRYQMVGDRG